MAKISLAGVDALTESGGIVTVDAGVLSFSDTPQAMTGAGAVSITTTLTTVASSGAIALTLADGTQGQIKIIVFITDGGNATLTPAEATVLRVVVILTAPAPVIASGVSEKPIHPGILLKTFAFVIFLFVGLPLGSSTT